MARFQCRAAAGMGWCLTLLRVGTIERRCFSLLETYNSVYEAVYASMEHMDEVTDIVKRSASISNVHRF